MFYIIAITIIINFITQLVFAAKMINSYHFQSKPCVILIVTGPSIISSTIPVQIPHDPLDCNLPS